MIDFESLPTPINIPADAIIGHSPGGFSASTGPPKPQRVLLRTSTTCPLPQPRNRPEVKGLGWLTSPVSPLRSEVVPFGLLEAGGCRTTSRESGL